MKDQTHGSPVSYLRDRVKRDAIYLVAFPTGISGFRGPDEPALVTGRVVKRDGLRPWTGQHLGKLDTLTWEMFDGHLPGHCPRGTLAQACEWLKANPYTFARVWDCLSCLSARVQGCPDCDP